MAFSPATPPELIEASIKSAGLLELLLEHSREAKRQTNIMMFLTAVMTVLTAVITYTTLFKG